MDELDREFLALKHRVERGMRDAQERKKRVPLKFCPACCEMTYIDEWSLDDAGNPVQCPECGWQHNKTP